MTTQRKVNIMEQPKEHTKHQGSLPCTPSEELNVEVMKDLLIQFNTKIESKIDAVYKELQKP